MFKFRIRKHEVGLLFRHGDFERVLQPGSHWLLPTLFDHSRQIEVIDRLRSEFKHKMLDVLVADPTIAKELTVVELTDEQRALVWKDGRLGWILGPGRHAFWKKPAKIEVETFDVNEFTFTHRKLETVLTHSTAHLYLDGVHIEPNERVLLFRDGELFDQLKPGTHVYWKHAGRIQRKVVDLREQVADVSGQEIMTADKVTLRVNLLVNYNVTDAEKAVSAVHDYEQALYREAQLVLRAAVSGRTLDKLLTDKDAVTDEVRQALVGRAAEFGVTLRSVGLRDVILPGDMKVMLNQVILAQKQAEANLIRRREETAAARSQANTAKLLAENPALARMKELEALQEILAGAKTTFVLGPGDVAQQVRRLVTEDVTDRSEQSS